MISLLEKTLYRKAFFSVFFLFCGEVTERPKVLAWKAGVLQGTEGSNPSLSAISFSGYGTYLPSEVTAGSRATDGRELRQTRKGAAAATSAVCRGGAWLSLVPASRRLRFSPVQAFLLMHQW